MSATNSTHESDSDAQQLDDRDRRALEQYLTVLDDVGRVSGADDMFLVVSESGSGYMVDTRVGACECPDHEYRDAHCKHLRRVAFATGERAVPNGVDYDDQLGQHVDGEPRLAATDGGIATADAGDGDVDDEGCDEPWCNGPDTGPLPCFDCYHAGEGEA
jgi:hypothetical protein